MRLPALTLILAATTAAAHGDGDLEDLSPLLASVSAVASRGAAASAAQSLTDTAASLFGGPGEAPDTDAVPLDTLAGSRKLNYVEGGAVDKLVNRKRAVARRNLKGDVVPKTFDPGSKDYVESLGILMTPGMLFAFLSLVCGVTFCVVRYGFDGFGGRKLPKGGYTRRQRLVIFGINALVLTVFLVCLIVGLVNSAKLTRSSSSFTTDLANGVSGLVQDTDDTVETLLDGQTFADQEIPKRNNVVELSDAAVLARERIRKSKKTIDDVDGYRVTALAFSVCIAVMAGIFGMLSGMLRRGVLSTIMMIMTFATLVLTWISFGVHLPVGVAVADFCYGMNDFVQGTIPPPPVDTKVGVAYFVSCFEPNTTLGVERTIVSFLDTSVATMNENRVNLNFEFKFNASRDPYEQITNLELQLGELAPEVQDQGQTFQRAYSRIEILTNLLVRTEKLLKCETIRDLYKNLERDLCLNVLQSLDAILIAQGLTGAFAVLAVYSSIRGMKRMRKLAQHLRLNADNDDDKARGAFAAADEEEMREVNARSNAHLDASKWGQI